MGELGLCKRSCLKWQPSRCVLMRLSVAATNMISWTSHYLLWQYLNILGGVATGIMASTVVQRYYFIICGRLIAIKSVRSNQIERSNIFHCWNATVVLKDRWIFWLGGLQARTPHKDFQICIGWDWSLEVNSDLSHQIRTGHLCWKWENKASSLN